MKTAWQQGVTHADYPTLKGDIETEIVIIGGGITGIVTAYQLALSGRKVVVLDKGTLFKNSTTAFTTGFLSSDIDTDFSDLVWMFGERVATDLLRSHMYAIDRIEKTVKDEKIGCEFERVPEYWYATSEKNTENLE
jgi:glycine/D-amino acid oxidase-like deaminating enzyme